MKRGLVTCLALGTLALVARETPAHAASTTPAGLANLCMFVNSRHRESDSSLNTYLYQTKLLEAAGAKEDDSADVIKSKMRRLWAGIAPQLTCSDPSFEVSQGSVLKYAVSSSFDQAVYDFVVNWDFPLDLIDKADGETALDFVSDQIEKHRGNALEGKLVGYFRMMRSHGGHLRMEIDGIDCRRERGIKPDVRCRE